MGEARPVSETDGSLGMSRSEGYNRTGKRQIGDLAHSFQRQHENKQSFQNEGLRAWVSNIHFFLLLGFQFLILEYSQIRSCAWWLQTSLQNQKHSYYSYIYI